MVNKTKVGKTYNKLIQGFILVLAYFGTKYVVEFVLS